MDEFKRAFRNSPMQSFIKRGSGRRFFRSGPLGILGLGAFLGGLLYNSMYSVETGHLAIKFNRFYGIQNKVFGEGLRFKIPFIEREIIYDARLRPVTITTETGSKDLQTINLSVCIIYRPKTSKLATVYREMGLNFSERILPSIANEVMKAVIAKYNAEQLLTKRDLVTADMSKTLKESALKYNIDISNVSITNLYFSKEYSDAVERKQIAKQAYARAEYEILKAKQLKKSAIVKASMEAEYIEKIGKEIQKNAAFLELRRMEAAKDIARSIARSRNKVYLDSDNLLLSLQGISNTNLTNIGPLKEED